jgi:hypothetical protein
MTFSGPKHPRAFLQDHTGRLSQVGGITAFTHAEGKAKGVSTLRVRTARGLEFWVVPDRGMDIYEASHLSRSLCWQSPTGMVHPAYSSSRGLEWLRNFSGGMLVTCGLSTVGVPSEDAGESLGLHGSISGTPAESVQWSEHWEGDDCLFTISGKVREASVHGHNLLLERTFSTSLHSASVHLHDTIENLGFRESPLMILYHFNFGFPLLTEKSRIYAPSKHIDSATDFAAADVERWSSFEAPKQGIAEKVYFHRMQPETDGRVTVVLVSNDEQRDFGVALSYDSSTLPEFIQWKMTGTNHFVLGLEPGNCRSLGRAAERQRGTLQFLQPGEKREFHVELRILDNAEEVANANHASHSA